jgi:hypothetical protein
LCSSTPVEAERLDAGRSRGRRSAPAAAVARRRTRRALDRRVRCRRPAAAGWRWRRSDSSPG